MRHLNSHINKQNNVYARKPSKSTLFCNISQLKGINSNCAKQKIFIVYVASTAPLRIRSTTTRYVLKRLVKSPARQLDLMSFRAIDANRPLSCGVVTLSNSILQCQHFALHFLATWQARWHVAHCSSLQAVLF